MNLIMKSLMRLFSRLFSVLLPAPADTEQLLWRAMITFIMAPTYAECRRVVEKYPVLLTDAAEPYLDRMIQDKPEIRPSAEKYRLLLRHCREGLAVSPEQLLQTLRSFAEASTLADRRRIIKQHPELLNSLADAQLQRTIQHQQTPEARQVLEEVRILLGRCRDVGVEATFGETNGGHS